MSKRLAARGLPEGRCQECDHDLEVPRGKHDGKVYCTNTGCTYHRKPHPTGKNLNAGLAPA